MIGSSSIGIGVSFLNNTLLNSSGTPGLYIFDIFLIVLQICAIIGIVTFMCYLFYKDFIKKEF